MRETDFINQNKEKWAEFEKELHLKNSNTQKLSDLFVQLTDDLSYSKTFYKNRSVKVYLNNLTQKVFQVIYKDKKNKWKLFVQFWKSDLPSYSWAHRRELSLSAVLFFCAFTLGVISCLVYPEFPRYILGESYIQMTMDNINKGDPMAVYKSQNKSEMFFQITYNNIMVAVVTYLLGLFLGIGTIASLLYNGIMLGAFQFFFFQKGLLINSLLAVWLHGTLEISAIIIAGGAGLTLSRGLLFPGTLSRFTAFRISANRSFRIIAGILPIFIFAGFIESFITRYYLETPSFLKAFLIVASLIFMVLYFIYIPFRNHYKRKMPLPQEGKIPAAEKDQTNLGEIKANGEILKSGFGLLGNLGSRNFMIVLGLSLLYAFITANFAGENLKFVFTFNAYNFFHAIALVYLFISDMLQYIDYSVLYFMIGNFIFFSLLTYLAIRVFCNSYNLIVSTSKKIISVLVLGLLSSAILTIPDGVGRYVFFFVYPVVLYMLPGILFEGKNTFTSAANTLNYSFGHFTRTIGLYITIAICFCLFFAFFASPYITWRIYAIINWGIPDADLDAEKFFCMFFSFLAYTGTAVFYLITVFCFLLHYFSIKEIMHAQALKEKISNIFNSKE